MRSWSWEFVMNVYKFLIGEWDFFIQYKIYMASFSRQRYFKMRLIRTERIVYIVNLQVILLLTIKAEKNRKMYRDDINILDKRFYVLNLCLNSNVANRFVRVAKHEVFSAGLQFIFCSSTFTTGFCMLSTNNSCMWFSIEAGTFPSCYSGWGVPFFAMNVVYLWWGSIKTVKNVSPSEDPSFPTLLERFR